VQVSIRETNESEPSAKLNDLGESGMALEDAAEVLNSFL